MNTGNKNRRRLQFATACAFSLSLLSATASATTPIAHPNDTVDTRTGNFTAVNRIWIHPKSRELPGMRMGPFVNLPGDRILTVDSTQCLVSGDNGKSWKAYPMFNDPSRFMIRVERAIVRTRKGTIIVAFMNEKERANWNWREDLQDSPGAELPTYAIRSEDEGRTWSEPMMLHRDWTGAIRDIVETKDGHVVFTTMMMLHNPGRHSVLTYTSADEGRSWKRSNIIDLGGVGHHSGVTESTLEELRDGSLLMYMRSNWGSLWETRSTDKGITWTGYRSTPIKASSAPGMFKRLQSGRLIMVWNQSMPQGKTSYPMRGGDNIWSEVYQSNHREELSVSFSEDEGRTWSKPVVIAKVTRPKSQVSYPYVLERKPGEVWVTTMFGELRMAFNERDLVGK